MAPPFLLELICLSLLVTLLVGLGYVIRFRWHAVNEPVPIPVAVGSWIFMIVVYFGFAALIIFAGGRSPFAGLGDKMSLDAPGTEEAYEVRTFARPDGTEVQVQEYRPSGANTIRLEELNNRVRPLVLYGVLGLLCVAYYTVLMVNAISQRFIEHIDPFSARIEDPSEFSEARKLALRGDIDGAVRVYQSYTDKVAEAHFEAARLLKSHDRFEEAARMLEDIANRFYGSRVIWADAMYQRAKILDNHLNRASEGAELLHQILARAPETRFGQLASNEMVRIRGLEGVRESAEDAAEPASAAPSRPPSGVLKQFEEPIQVKPRGFVGDDYAAPPVDPFYVRRHGLTEPSAPPAVANAPTSESDPDADQDNKSPDA